MLLATPVRTGALDADINRAARADGHVLILGESGAAAEVVARLIHQRHPRHQLGSQVPFRTLRCAGLPESLVESQLFGHRRGSFRGAYCDRPGLVDDAAGGTLFLPDIAAASAGAQNLLMLFLDAGGVRIIAAANGRLPSRIASGAFREVLWRRLNGSSLLLPPLSERREDISFFLDVLLRAADRNHRTAVRSISDEAMRLLLDHDWPGNVGELRTVVDRLDLLAPGPAAQPADLQLTSA